MRPERQHQCLLLTYGMMTLLSFPVNTTYAGDVVSANPTRPSVTDNAFVTAAGYAELEIGGQVSEGAWNIPTLLKFGLSESVELSAAMTGLLDHTTAAGTDLGTTSGVFRSG